MFNGAVSSSLEARKKHVRKTRPNKWTTDKDLNPRLPEYEAVLFILY
jgi:hypothetical protein